MRFSSSSRSHLATTIVATPLPTRLVRARISDMKRSTPRRRVRPAMGTVPMACKVAERVMKPPPVTAAAPLELSIRMRSRKASWPPVRRVLVACATKIEQNHPHSVHIILLSIDAIDRRRLRFRGPRLFPVRVGLFFFVVQEAFFVLVVFLHFLGCFQLQRTRAHHSQVGPALVTTDGIAFVDVFFFHIDCALTYRTCDHRQFLPR